MIISSTKFFRLRSVQLFKKIQRHSTIILLSRKIKYSITEIGFSSIRTRIYTTSTPRLGKTRELLGRRSSWTRISSNTRSKSCRTRGCKRSEAYKRIPCRVVASSRRRKVYSLCRSGLIASELVTSYSCNSFSLSHSISLLFFPCRVNGICYSVAAVAKVFLPDHVR